MEHKTTDHPRGRVRRALRRTVGLLVALIVFSLFYLVTFGFPAWLRDETLTRISRGDFAVFASAIRLDPVHGIAMKDVRVFRKGVVGPAALEAKHVVATVSIVELLTDKSRMEKLTVSGGVFRPPMLHCPGGPKVPRRPVPMDTLVELRGFKVQGLTVDRVSFRLSAYGDIARYDKIDGIIGTGPMAGHVSGELAFDANTCLLTGRFVSEFDLHLLMPIFKAWRIGMAERIVRDFEFGEGGPRCEVSFEKHCIGGGRFTIDSKFWTENSTFRGVDMLRADGRLKAELGGTNSWVSVDPMLIVRQEGVAKGSFKINPASRTIEFDATSSLHPQAACGLVGTLTNTVRLFEFNGAVRVDAKGKATFKMKPPGHDFTLQVDGRDTGIGPVNVEKYSFTSRTVGISNIFSDIRGRLYGGDFSGSARLKTPTGTVEHVWYELEGKAADVDFGEFAGAVIKGEKRDFSGKLWVEGKLSGFAGEGNGRTARGYAEVGVDDGRVFMLPIFGGLSSMMVKVIPGLDFVLRQSDAQADLTINDGRIHSRKIKIEGDILSLQGHGSCGIDGSLDYDAQLKLMKEHTIVAKLLRALTYPITKLFEFRLTGTRDDPKWYPENFSADLLKKLGLKKHGVEKRKLREPR